MGLPSNTNALQNGFWQGYTVGRSLRFRSSASAYLNRTPSSASNRQIWTWSSWVKRGQLGAYNVLFSAANGASTRDYISFDSNDRLTFDIADATAGQKTTTQVFRDPSAWYHIVVAEDTTQATANNRIRMYVNGVEVTAFTLNTAPSQNYSGGINNNVVHRIANAAQAGNAYLDGYMAEVNFIDGQQLTPSAFGAYDNTGIWEPIKYTGTYGTNGFYLPFSDTTSTTTLVADSSGNGNNWTPNNISLTAGVTYDSMIDSPTVSNLSSNYAVLNPNDKGSNLVVANANLNVSIGGTGGNDIGRATISIPSTGKWYWETTIAAIGAGVAPGIITNAVTLNSGSGTLYGVFYNSNGTYTTTWGTNVSYGSTFTTNDVIGVAYDAGANSIVFYKNNVSQGAITPSSSGLPYFPAIFLQTTANINLNFGQRPFTYTPPSGYSALNTANLPAPLVSNGAMYVAATTYTGNGSTLSVTNNVNNTSASTFQPDFTWIKSRSNTYDNALYDSVRGATLDLVSNSTAAQTTQTTGLTSFDTSGFTVGALTKVNNNASTYIAWQWKGGGTGVSNTSGSITSTVSASATSGFSVVSYTGTGANATIGHGLGVAPSMIIVKKLSATGNWSIYHVGNPSAAASYAIFLNTTAAAGSNATYWNSTAPTSSVFSVGTNTDVNASGSTYVAYCFSSVGGYASFGSYTGNGSSTDGPFIYTGFRPRIIIVKRSVGAIASWVITDTSRSPYNLDQTVLYPNLTNADATVSFGDILSNGFKIKATAGEINTSSSTYIYAAFAENPFNTSRAR
jgi:hypothetical protein